MKKILKIEKKVRKQHCWRARFQITKFTESNKQLMSRYAWVCKVLNCTARRRQLTILMKVCERLCVRGESGFIILRIPRVSRDSLGWKKLVSATGIKIFRHPHRACRSVPRVSSLLTFGWTDPEGRVLQERVRGAEEKGAEGHGGRGGERGEGRRGESEEEGGGDGY